MAGENVPDRSAHYVCVMGRGRGVPGAKAVCSRGCDPFEDEDHAAVNAWAEEHRASPGPP